MTTNSSINTNTPSPFDFYFGENFAPPGTVNPSQIFGKQTDSEEEIDRSRKRKAESKEPPLNAEHFKKIREEGQRLTHKFENNIRILGMFQEVMTKKLNDTGTLVHPTSQVEESYLALQKGKENCQSRALFPNETLLMETRIWNNPPNNVAKNLLNTFQNVIDKSTQKAKLNVIKTNVEELLQEKDSLIQKLMIEKKRAEDQHLESENKELKQKVLSLQNLLSKALNDVDKYQFLYLENYNIAVQNAQLYQNREGDKLSIIQDLQIRLSKYESIE